MSPNFQAVLCWSVSERVFSKDISYNYPGIFSPFPNTHAARDLNIDIMCVYVFLCFPLPGYKSGRFYPLAFKGVRVVELAAVLIMYWDNCSA